MEVKGKRPMKVFPSAAEKGLRDGGNGKTQSFLEP